jgi:16S rRNA (cytidine1402-2'-O)-methyltransferase
VARHTPSARGPQAASEPKSAAAKLQSGLHLVATPIGNMGDISARATAVLAAADVVACEDTRVTGQLLARLGISAALVPYHDHNAEAARPALIERMRAGGAVALVSDAGTPAISDPGYKLVRACIDEGIAVTAVPGPNAALTALVISGMPTDRFLFAGFLPAKTQQRKTALAELARVPATLLFQESAPRLAGSLTDMAEVLGAREAAVARELTKMFEEVRRGSLESLAEHYDRAGPPKGEIIVVVGPPPDVPAAAGETVEAMLADALLTMSVRDAAEAVAAATGRPRREVYALALQLSKET